MDTDRVPYRYMMGILIGIPEVSQRHSEQPDGHDFKFYAPKFKYWNEYIYG
jgi:hypothetical protein